MYDRRIRIPKPQTLTLYELVCIFLVVALLYLFRNKFYRGLGATAIGIIIGLCVLIFIKKASAFELSPVTKIFLVLQGYFLGRFFAEWNISGYYNCFQAVLLLFCFSILIQSSIRSNRLQIFAYEIYDSIICFVRTLSDCVVIGTNA